MKFFILAGGYSTRTRKLGIEQKALARVVNPFTDDVDYLVNHQIEFAKKVVPETDIVVVTGWKGDELKKLVNDYYPNVDIIVDKYILGLGVAWLQIIYRLGTIDFISLNVDNIHGLESVVKLKEYLNNRRMLVFGVHKRFWKGGSGDTILVNDNNKFLGFGESNYMMSGLYMLKGEYVANLVPHYKAFEKKEEFTPKMVFNQFLKMRSNIYVEKIIRWYDAGSSKGLKKILV